MSNPILEERSEVTGAGSENCLPIGTRVAEFEITGVVGEGGFGVVYLAMDHSLQRIVALKEYMPNVMAGRGSDQSVVVRSKRHQEAFDTGLRSFINEARLLAQFDHPALIKIHRFWEQNNTGYMAMRFYEGRTLKRIVQHDPQAVTEAWLKVIVQSILEALEALYKVQILHRDISPENIMIQNNGEAVLLDFGAARQIISDMTQALTVILKPGYAPIEQYADDPSMLQGPWTDIYSLSAVMYVAVTNKTPPSSVARMIQDPIVPLTTTEYPAYSAQFLQAINQGLSVKPEHRPRSITEFRALLGLGASSGPAFGDTPRQQVASTAIAGLANGPASVTGAGIAETVRTTDDPKARPHEKTIGKTIGKIFAKGGDRSRNVEADDRQAGRTGLPPGSTDPAASAATLDPSTRPMTHAAPAGSPAGPTAAVRTTMPAPPGKTAVAANAADRTPQPTAQAGASAASGGKRSTMRVAILSMVIVAAGVATWRITHREPALVGATMPSAGGLASEQVIDDETLAWETLRQRTDIDADKVGRFIAQYPNGRLIDVARKRLEDLNKAPVVGATESAAPTPAPTAAASGAGTAAATGLAALSSAAATPGMPNMASATNTAAAPASTATADHGSTPAEPAMVSVTLSIKPWGNVTIDGIDRGVSPPLKKLSLAEGRHALRVVNPGFPDHVAQIEIGKKKSSRITVDFTPAVK